MNTIFTRLRLTMLAILITGGMALSYGMSSSEAAPPERHPHIRKAIRELREAKNELVTANHDFGGHRADAVKATELALQELQQALKFDHN